MTREIFISYSRKDLEKVKTIKEHIEKLTSVKCWMDLEGIESGAQQFTQDIVDGINEINPDIFNGKETIYNLMGQKLQKIQKGINIVNGRKVLVK